MFQLFKDFFSRDWYHLSFPLKFAMIISVVAFYVALMGNITNIYKEPLHCMGSSDVMEYKTYFSSICKAGKLYTKEEEYFSTTDSIEEIRVSISYFEEQPMMAAMIAASFCGFLIFSHYERGEMTTQTQFERLKLTETTRDTLLNALKAFIMRSTLFSGHWAMEVMTEILSIALVGMQFFCLNWWMNDHFSTLGIMYLKELNIISSDGDKGFPVKDILGLLFPVKAFCDIDDFSGPSGTWQNRTLTCAINSNALFGKFMLLIFFVDVAYIIATLTFLILKLFIFTNPFMLKCYPGIVFNRKNNYKVIANLSGTQYHTYQIVMANISMNCTTLAEDLERLMANG
jgi:hypothetical protein